LKLYFLTRSSRPKLQEGQMTVVYMCLEPYGSKKSLDQLVRECLSRNYASTFKQIHEGAALTQQTEISILYHINRMGPLVGCEETNG
jgi:hypothetical protein